MRDLDPIFDALSRSAFRSRFKLGAKERAYLADRGLAAVVDHAALFIARRLASAEPVNDGKQTPMRGHPAFIAQHATATCCRSCLAKWHGIPAGRPLNDAEQHHIAIAIERWLRNQQPPRTG
jgi:hypothetical protein